MQESVKIIRNRKNICGFEGKKTRKELNIIEIFFSKYTMCPKLYILN